MPVYDASGQADGVSTTVGAAGRDFPTAGSTVGDGVLDGVTTEKQVAAGTASGSATPSSVTTMTMVAAGLAIGLATTVGDVNPQAAGTASGTSLLSGVAMMVPGASGTASGVSTTSGTVGFGLIVTGRASGQATVEGDWGTSASGTAVGQATVPPPTAVRVLRVSGSVEGTSGMGWIYPLPIHGTSSLAAHIVVETHLPAIRAVVAPPKTFRYMQVLQRGDLPIYLCDANGPVSPYKITFTLFQQRPDGTSFQVGPQHRTPAEGEVGEFYVTGRAGESGQPGCWHVRWEWQRSFDGAYETKEMEFRVEDAVLAGDPRDVTVRVRKYGWN